MTTSPPSPAPPISDADWPACAADLLGSYATNLNVYRVMAHNPKLLVAWTDFRNHVVLNSALSPMQSEIVILRTGFRRGSYYEWAQHVVRGASAGLSTARISSVRTPEHAPPEDAMLITAVDALIDNGRFDPALRVILLEALGLTATIDIIATVGMYTTLAFLIESFEVPLEQEMLRQFEVLREHLT